MIVVNVFGFDMKYWDAGCEVFEFKVVVGKIIRLILVMNIKFDLLIINLIWNVLYKIMVEDILLMVKCDSEYFVNYYMEIICGWSDLEVIDFVLIDWEVVELEIFLYCLC